MLAADRLKVLRQRAQKEELVILVWGPGDPGTSGSAELRRYWAKRQQIRDILANAFPSSEVLFSEAKELRDHTRSMGDLLSEELQHATVADCILVLDVSRGAHVEVDRFSAYPIIASKMRVLIPKQYVGGKGLASTVHIKLQVRGFTERQFEQCSLAKKTCVDLIYAVAIEKIMRNSGLPPF